MVKRKLDGAVNESLADQEIYKSNAIVHNQWKIWRPTPSGTGPYSRQVGRRTLGKILKACCR